MRIAVIEDNARFRKSLATLLLHSEGLELAADFCAAEPALRASESSTAGDSHPPWDMVLMDIELPAMSGIDATRRLKQRWPTMPVVMLTAFEEPRVILEAICAGADGYLLKKTSAGEIVAQLRSVAAGGAPLTGGVARTVLDLVRADGPRTSAPVHPTTLHLTEREQQVLRGLTQGLSYKQIADRLEISTDTVRYFIRLVYGKLQVHSVAEAVGRAIREGLI